MNGLRPLGGILHLEGHPLALLQVAIPFCLDAGEVHEDLLLLVIWGNEAIPLHPAEPLHRSFSTSAVHSILRWLLSLPANAKSHPQPPLRRWLLVTREAPSVPHA